MIFGAPVVVLPAGQSAHMLPPHLPAGHTPFFDGVPLAQFPAAVAPAALVE